MTIARISLAALAAALVVSPVAAPAAAAQAATAQTPSQALAALFEASDEANLKRNPISGLFRGDDRYAAHLGNLFSNAYYAAEREAAEAELAALAKIDRSKLSAQEQISYDVFKWQRELDLRGLQPDLLAATAVRPIDHFNGVHAFWSLQEGEMTERGLTERQELDPDAGWVGIGGHREVRPRQARRGPHRGEQVLDEREVEHLLRADLEQRRPPATDGRQRVFGQAFLGPLLEREGREEVLEHHQVLELRGLAKGVDERLAMLEAAGVRIVRPASDLQDVGQRAVRTEVDHVAQRTRLRGRIT